MITDSENSMYFSAACQLADAVVTDIFTIDTALVQAWSLFTHAQIDRDLLRSHMQEAVDLMRDLYQDDFPTPLLLKGRFRNLYESISDAIEKNENFKAINQEFNCHVIC
jgi:hypothetical protein